MKTVLAGCFIVLVSLIVLLFAFVWLWRKWSEYEDRVYFKRREKFRKDLGAKIAWDAYWFSSDKKVFNALNMVGQQLLETGNYDIESIRDKVRELGDDRHWSEK